MTNFASAYDPAPMEYVDVMRLFPVKAVLASTSRNRESYAAMGSSCGGVGSGMMTPLYISSDVLPRMLRATLR